MARDKTQPLLVHTALFSLTFAGISTLLLLQVVDTQSVCSLYSKCIKGGWEGKYRLVSITYHIFSNKKHINSYDQN